MYKDINARKASVGKVRESKSTCESQSMGEITSDHPGSELSSEVSWVMRSLLTLEAFMWRGVMDREPSYGEERACLALFGVC
jgi:hypothetical protein